MLFDRTALQALLDTADCWLSTRYATKESTDKVLWLNGQAYHLTLQNDAPDNKIVLTAISDAHCLNLF